MTERVQDNRSERFGATDEDNPRFSLTAVKWGRLFGYLKPYWGRMTLAILAFPALIVRLLDSVTRSHELSSLNMLAGVLIGVFLCQAAFNFLQSYLLAFIGERIVLDLRTSLYGHLQELSLDFYAFRRWVIWSRDFPVM